MTVITKEGKVNDDTILIDIRMFGVPKITGIYVIESGKTCLVDAGTHTEARKILRQLKDLNVFPPDKIVLTHSHWDHCQAIPFLNQRAMKEGKEIEIYASENAIPYLQDQSYNEVFGTGPFNNIEADIIPLKEGDTIDLDGISLKVFETPGHMVDSLAYLDEKNMNLFVGDTLGDKISDNIFVPPCMPPFWDKDAYLKTIDKIKRIKYESISLQHFGFVHGEEAKSILDESVENLNKWWIILEENVNNLDDIPYMIEEVLPEVIPKAELDMFPLKLKQAVIFWISEGFKKSKGI